MSGLYMVIYLYILLGGGKMLWIGNDVILSIG